MVVERWTDSMLDQLTQLDGDTAVLARNNSEMIAANSQAIAALRGTTRENARAIDDLRILVADLREGQAILPQILVEEREARQEFRCTTNAALDRIDHTLEELRRDRENGN